MRNRVYIDPVKVFQDLINADEIIKNQIISKTKIIEPTQKFYDDYVFIKNTTVKIVYKILISNFHTDKIQCSDILSSSDIDERLITELSQLINSSYSSISKNTYFSVEISKELRDFIININPTAFIKNITNISQERDLDTSNTRYEENELLYTQYIEIKKGYSDSRHYFSKSSQRIQKKKEIEKLSHSGLIREYIRLFSKYLDYQIQEVQTEENSEKLDKLETKLKIIKNGLIQDEKKRLIEETQLSKRILTVQKLEDEIEDRINEQLVQRKESYVEYLRQELEKEIEKKYIDIYSNENTELREIFDTVIGDLDEKEQELKKLEFELKLKKQSLGINEDEIRNHQKELDFQKNQFEKIKRKSLKRIGIRLIEVKEKEKQLDTLNKEYTKREEILKDESIVIKEVAEAKKEYEKKIKKLQSKIDMYSLMEEELTNKQIETQNQKEELELLKEEYISKESKIIKEFDEYIQEIVYKRYSFYTKKLNQIISSFDIQDIHVSSYDKEYISTLKPSIFKIFNKSKDKKSIDNIFKNIEEYNSGDLDYGVIKLFKNIIIDLNNLNKIQVKYIFDEYISVLLRNTLNSMKIDFIKNLKDITAFDVNDFKYQLNINNILKENKLFFKNLDTFFSTNFNIYIKEFLDKEYFNFLSLFIEVEGLYIKSYNTFYQENMLTTEKYGLFEALNNELGKTEIEIYWDKIIQEFKNY